MVDIEKNPIFRRLTTINQFRYNHNQLKQIILKTLNKNSDHTSGRTFEEKALNDIQEAYSQFLHINVLDISKEGQDLWDATKRNYDNKIDKVESQITIALKERLASTGNANEMFKVFSFFKPLFSRQRIKGAIREY